MNFGNFGTRGGMPFGFPGGAQGLPQTQHTKLYDDLGVKPDATEEEITKAYRSLVKKYHTDRNKSEDAEEMIKKINYAHDILSNKEKRDIYDQVGEEGLQGGGFDAGFDPMDILRSMHQQNTRKVKKMSYSVKLEDYFTKRTIRVPIPLEVKCHHCDVTGFTDRQSHKCQQCGGSGMVMQRIQQGPMITQFQRPCSVCQGQGLDLKYAHLLCQKCQGKTVLKTKEEVDVDIPKNILKHNMTVLEGKGPMLNGVNVDLAIEFQLKFPKGYGMTMSGGMNNDRKLIYTMHINYPETVCGFRRKFVHPSGKEILVVSEKGYVINPDHIYMLENLGFNGDLMYLAFVINYPETIKMPVKKYALNFDNLEKVLGERLESNTKGDSEIDPENVYTLSTLNKMNNNPRARREDESDSSSNCDSNENDSDSDDQRGHGQPEQVNCAQQ